MKDSIVEARRLAYTFKFPADRFELLEELPSRKYEYRMKSGRMKSVLQHMVRLRCRRCGDIKVVCDKPNIGCKQEICHERHVDRTGKHYGDLVVLKSVRTDHPKHIWQWLCECKCGRKEVVLSQSLCNGKSSCEICGRERTRQATTKPGFGALWSRVMRQYRRNSLKRGQEFSLSDEEMRELFGGNCFYCNMPPRPDVYGLVRNGIDRKDDNKGYTRDNVVSCCSICNIMKAAHSVESFLAQVKRIYDNKSYLLITFNDYPEREYIRADGNGTAPEQRNKRQFGGA